MGYSIYYPYLGAKHSWISRLFFWGGGGIRISSKKYKTEIQLKAKERKQVSSSNAVGGTGYPVGKILKVGNPVQCRKHELDFQ